MIAVPTAVWDATVAQFRSCGQGRRECVVYWLASGQAPTAVRRVVHPVHTATPRHYKVDDGWLNAFWIELARVGERVVVQVHTHGGRASHSRTDDEGALVYQPGFLSLVLPDFAMGDDCRAGAFLAEEDGTGAWLPLPLEERIRWL